MTKKELLEIRWHLYEKFADRSDNYWREHPGLMRTMYDIVDGLRVALEDNGVHEHCDNVKNISIASYSDPYDDKRVWPRCVKLRAEFNASGSIILYVDGWPMWFYDEGREQLSIVVRELSNAKELIMWLGHWTEAAEECKEATLKTIKRRYLKELMQLPNDSLDGSFE